MEIRREGSIHEFSLFFFFREKQTHEKWFLSFSCELSNFDGTNKTAALSARLAKRKKSDVSWRMSVTKWKRRAYIGVSPDFSCIFSTSSANRIHIICPLLMSFRLIFITFSKSIFVSLSSSFFFFFFIFPFVCSPVFAISSAFILYPRWQKSSIRNYIYFFFLIFIVLFKKKRKKKKRDKKTTQRHFYYSHSILTLICRTKN